MPKAKKTVPVELLERAENQLNKYQLALCDVVPGGKFRFSFPVVKHGKDYDKDEAGLRLKLRLSYRAMPLYLAEWTVDMNRSSLLVMDDNEMMQIERIGYGTSIGTRMLLDARAELLRKQSEKENKLNA